MWKFHQYLYNKQNITWLVGDTNFIFSCWKYLSLIRCAHSWEILSALEDKIRTPAWPCNILYVRHKNFTFRSLFVTHMYNTKLELTIIENLKKCFPWLKNTRICPGSSLGSIGDRRILWLLHRILQLECCLFHERGLPFHNNPPVTLQSSPATPVFNENPAPF